MSLFPNHTPETAPVDAKPFMDQAQRAYGMIPNLYAKMAEAPALLQGYHQLGQLFASSGLNAVEQQVVLLTVSRENHCEYCVGAHSVIADMNSVPSEVTDAIREGETIGDSRLEALRQFTAQLVEQRGWMDEQDIRTFLEAGFTPANVLEVVLGIGMKTLSNYTNHLVGTELDDAFVGRAWQSPAKK